MKAEALTFWVPPCVPTCCAVGTLRPRLFFVKFGTGTGGARRRAMENEPVDVDGDVEDVESPRRRVRGECCTYSSSSSSSSPTLSCSDSPLEPWKSSSSADTELVKLTPRWRFRAAADAAGTGIGADVAVGASVGEPLALTLPLSVKVLGLAPPCVDGTEPPAMEIGRAHV